MDEDIPRMDPEGLQMFPTKPVEIPKVDSVDVPGVENKFDDRVSWLAIVALWVKENLINDILNSQLKGSAMNSSLWYASKTIWVNFLVMLWTFVGPLVGIPVLTPELMFVALVVINLVLRVVTGSPIALIEQFASTDPAKPWYASKAIWINVLTVAWFFIGPLVGMPSLPPDLLVGILGVINILLRFVTKQPIVFFDEATPPAATT
jgi:hypothetical protein